jgi:hypothetical protein
MSKYIQEYKGFTLLFRPQSVGAGRFMPRLSAARDNGDSYEEHCITLPAQAFDSEAEAKELARRRGVEWVDKR